MHRRILFVWLMGLSLGWCQSSAADSHRIIVVSATDQQGREPCEVRVIEVESAKTLAKIQVGEMAEAALSPRGDMLAILSHYSVAGFAPPRARLEIFRASDLAIVQRGYLPVPRATHKLPPNSARMLFSVEGEVVVQRNDGHDAVLSRVRLELDEEGVFQLVGQPVKLAGAEGVSFLRTEWPQVTVFGFDGVIHVLDLDRDTDLGKTDVEARAMSIWGKTVTSDGKYGYYVPQSSGSRPAGRLQRIDLTAEPPKAIRISEQLQSGLRARVSAVSEKAGALLVADQKWVGGGHFPSPRIRFFHTLTLAEAREIEVSLSDCDSISTSIDGKYAYVLDYFHGGLSVVEIRSGRELKRLNEVGTHPAFAIALP